MIKSVYVIPLAEVDINRVSFTVESIRDHCEDYEIALVSDGVVSRDSIPEGDDIKVYEARYLSKGHWGAIWLNQMSVMRDYFMSGRTNEETIYIKIDSDALVLKKGIYQRASNLFRSRPKVGQIGQVYSDCLGNRLANLGWRNFYNKTYGVRGLKMFLFGKSCPDTDTISVGDRVRAWFRYRDYLSNNTEPQTYGIGGCYILSSGCVQKVIDTGVIDEKTFLLTPGFGEDAIMGLMVGCVGLTKLDDVSDQGLFAVGGLYDKTNDKFRANPLDIAKRGHYIVHPFKFGYKSEHTSMSEAELVQALNNISKDQNDTY